MAAELCCSPRHPLAGPCPHSTVHTEKGGMGTRGCSGPQLCLLSPSLLCCHRAVSHRFPALGKSSKTISNQSAKRAFTSIGLAFPQGQPPAPQCSRLLQASEKTCIQALTSPGTPQHPAAAAPGPLYHSPWFPALAPSQLQSCSGEHSNSSRGLRQSSLHCKTSL